MDQAEQLRNIIKAENVQRPMARVLTVTSGKGGVGKSNTAINLAIQFRRLGQRVIILDADFGLANIEIMFGTVPKHNLCDLIYQGKNIREIITWGPMDVGFVSGGSGIVGMSNLSRDYLSYIIKNLAELDAIADVIIVDTGAGIADAVLEFLVASGEILLITTPEPTSITDSYSLLKASPFFTGEYAGKDDCQQGGGRGGRRNCFWQAECRCIQISKHVIFLSGCRSAGQPACKGSDAAGSRIPAESACKG